MRKRILFFRPRKDSDFNPIPQIGLGILARILRQAGHEVVVCDHLLFIKREAPSVEELMETVRPDVVGLTTFTSTMTEARKIMKRVRAMRPDVPIIVGGPHTSIHTADLQREPDIDYIVTGEAESVILNLVETAERQPSPQVVPGAASDVVTNPFPDFTAFLGIDGIEEYPLETSRGCPFRCNFCSVPLISSKKWRRREISTCVDEVEAAKAVLPNLRGVVVVDDVPTINLKRFKEFLRAYIDRDLGLPLHIDNIRADEIDREFVLLAKQAGVTRICIAVEHGNPEVLKMVDKGETHEDIVRAAALIRGEGLDLECCFIVGLPLDSLERTKDSIAFAKQLKARYIFWNMAHPMPGTTMYNWFKEKNATFYYDEDYTSFAYHTVRCEKPIVETPEFTREERVKAYFLAVISTDQFKLNRDLWPFMQGVVRYGYFGEGARAVGRFLVRRGSRLLQKGFKRKRVSERGSKSSWGMDAPVPTRESGSLKDHHISQ